MKTAAGVWFAPGRANLMGEHTDYNGGFVLPFALAQGVTAAVSARDDGLLVLRSKQAAGDPVTAPVASLMPGAVTGWAAYAAGVAWALRAAGYPVSGATVEIDSDLPVGAGVSSSAALECSVALALCALSGVEVPRPALAAIAKRAENEFVGAPTGIIDQSAALLCTGGHALLLDCATLRTVQVPFRPGPDGVCALVIDTRVAHALVSGEYAARRAECEQAARLLGVAALGTVTDPRAANELADPVLRRRARHVVTDDLRVRQVTSLLRASHGGDFRALSEVGALLTQSHASLRDDFQVSWPEADVTVQVAVDAGALGARMTGGGFGGSALALVPEADVEPVQDQIRTAFADRGWTEPEFLSAFPSGAAQRMI